jgi:hypothetical protein
LKVDEVLSNVEGLPESLVQSYYDMMKEDLKDRINNDPDYRDKKQSGSSQFEYLDRL